MLSDKEIDCISSRNKILIEDKNLTQVEEKCLNFFFIDCNKFKSDFIKNYNNETNEFISCKSQAKNKLLELCNNNRDLLDVANKLINFSNYHDEKHIHGRNYLDKYLQYCLSKISTRYVISDYISFCNFDIKLDIDICMNYIKFGYNYIIIILYNNNNFELIELIKFFTFKIKAKTINKNNHILLIDKGNNYKFSEYKVYIKANNKLV
jgi:hypothetical protein